MAKKSSKPRKASKYPSIFEMFKVRMQRENRYEELMTRYKFHRDFGSGHSQAMWEAIRDLGYKSSAEEKRLWDEHNENGRKSREREVRRKEMEAEQLETELRELQRDSAEKKFNPVDGIEWVASVFHLDHVTPAECPHIIAWNILQTSK